MIKVNAECDKGVAPLVSALNRLDGVTTLDSCQKGVSGEAFVFFTYGDSWNDLANLLQTISSELSTIKRHYSFTLRLEWWGSNEYPRAEIILLPEHVDTLSGNIESLADKINRHMCQLVRDKRYKELHN